LKQFFLDSTRYGFALAMPMLLILAVFGDVILRIWMGPRYEHGITMTIIAVCFMLPVAQGVSMRIMMGTNSHGRVAIISLLITLVVFSAVLLYIDQTEWSLRNAALLAGLPLAVGNGMAVPFFACRQMHVGFAEYLRNAWSVPVMCNLVFVIVLFSARLLFPGNLLVAFVAGSSVGLLMLAVLYWFYLLSPQLRNRLIGLVRRR
jgi:hypothetical protein